MLPWLNTVIWREKKTFIEIENLTNVLSKIESTVNYFLNMTNYVQSCALVISPCLAFI